jgi:hypothetical protein
MSTVVENPFARVISVTATDPAIPSTTETSGAPKDAPAHGEPSTRPRRASSFLDPSKAEPVIFTHIRDTAYFLPKERGVIRTSCASCTAYVPVCVDFSWSRHRSHAAAAFLYLQLALSSLFFCWRIVTGDFVALPNCSAVVSAPASSTIDLLYVGYLATSLLANSRWQSPPWLLLAAPFAVSFFAVYSAVELPHCLALAGALPLPVELSLLGVTQSVAAYGVFRWLATGFVVLELARLTALMARDVACRGAPLGCAVEMGAAPGAGDGGGGGGDVQVDVNSAEEAAGAEAAAAAAAAPIVPLKQRALAALGDAAARLADLPLRFVTAVCCTCLVLLFFAAAADGWCRAGLRNVPNNSANNPPFFNTAFDVSRVVLAALPIATWAVTAFFWAVNLHSLYAVSEQQRHLSLRYASAKAGVRAAGMDATLDALRAPQLSRFSSAEAAFFIFAHLICNLLAVGLALIVVVCIIIFKVVETGWETVLSIAGSLFSLPFLLGLLQSKLPGIAPTFAHYFFKYCVDPFATRCGDRAVAVTEPIRRALAYTCCLYSCGSDGPHVLVPRFFLLMDCALTFVFAPFAGTAFAALRCFSGALWGIVALAQLHNPLLPPFLAYQGFDKPFIYHGSMLRTSNQDLIDEENNAVPVGERKAAWK